MNVITRKAKAPAQQTGAKAKYQQSNSISPQRQIPKEDTREWCSLCGLPIYYNSITRLFSCWNGCNIRQDTPFMDAIERREWLADQIFEHKHQLHCQDIKIKELVAYNE